MSENTESNENMCVGLESCFPHDEYGQQTPPKVISEKHVDGPS